MKNDKTTTKGKKASKTPKQDATTQTKKGNDQFPPVPNPDNRTTRTKKKAMILAMEKTMGMVTLSCRGVGIDRTTYYRWLEKDAKFAEAVEELRISVKDFGENALHLKMSQGDTAAIIFFNKTQNKDRGYVERSEVTGADGKPFIPKRQVMIIGGKEVEFY